MTQPFTPEQSREIDDRIVKMIAAALGEGPAARRARAIANERWLNYPPETSEQDLKPLPPEDSGLSSGTANALPRLTATFPIDRVRAAAPKLGETIPRAGALARVLASLAARYAGRGRAQARPRKGSAHDQR